MVILRTPRRRVSYRTKEKYRVVKNFVRRALGAGSKTTSSIEVSVSGLKSQTTGIEEQQSEDSEHCRDLTCLECSFREESENSVSQFERDDRAINQQEECVANVKNVESKLINKSLNRLHRNSANNWNTVNDDRHDDTIDMATGSQRISQNIQDLQVAQKENVLRKIKRKESNYNVDNRRKEYLKHNNTIGPLYSTNSFSSLLEPRNKDPRQRHEKRHWRKEFTDPFVIKADRETRKNDLRNYKRVTLPRHQRKRTKRVYSEIDRHFIDDIIKKQYKPIKLFGRRDSDFSQFSAPVCRDQEFKMSDGIKRGDLCSCCFNDYRKKRHRYVRYNDLSDMRSICDTRLYSSKKHKKYKQLEGDTDDYNDATLYDVVPVREKCSPKARRKLTEDNMISYQYSREVPPSPRSNRPKLNLKVQHITECDDSSYNSRLRSQRISPIYESRKKISRATDSDASSVSYLHKTQPSITLNGRKYLNPVQTLDQDRGTIGQDFETIRNNRDTIFTNEQVNIPSNDTTLNTHLTDFTADKTDKTLSEIKDILKTFLLEIKKESTRSTNELDSSGNPKNKQATQHQGTKTNSNIIPNSGYNFSNYSVDHCAGTSPFAPTFPNPCCYPILPLCPMSCIQNGYILPNPSYTCTACVKNSKEHACCHNSKPAEEANNETQELIKEIYKHVLQKPKSSRKAKDNDNEDTRSKNERFTDKKVLTSSFAGGSNKVFKHDANVGTPQLKYYSKSCEAFGSRVASDIHNTNASYSETVIEKLSLEASQSSTQTDISIPVEKVKRENVRKVFNPWRIFRKKKKDIIEDISESTVEDEEKMKCPFEQHIQSYAMHGQEYYYPPPIPSPRCSVPPHHDCCEHRYETTANQQHLSPSDFYNHHPHQSPPSRYNPKYSSAPMYPHYDRHYNHTPQVPLCLKEVEVKSMGTQSERKVSLLQKLTQKLPAQHRQQQEQHNTPVKEKPNFWKALQEKAKETDNNTMNFSLKMQKQLAQGDMNMKSAMMKKLFYKKNPFSPRNLIVRTLLGKDKSSYGNPPKMYRPRMFL